MYIKNISGKLQVFSTMFGKIEVAPNGVIQATGCPNGFEIVEEPKVPKVDEVKTDANVITEQVPYNKNVVTEVKGLMKSAGIFGADDSSTVIGDTPKVKGGRGRK